MKKTYYICKYTPVELLKAFGAECENINGMPRDFTYADQFAHSNLCGFGKALIEAVMSGQVKELILVNCCDTIRSVYDVLAHSGKMDFLYLLDVLRSDGSCSRERLSMQLRDLAKVYGEYRGACFDRQLFQESFQKADFLKEPYISVLGARMGDELLQMVESSMPYAVMNEACVGNRFVGQSKMPEDDDLDSLIDWYAGELLGQMPCMRMQDHTGRKQLLNDPNLKGIVYHTVKFCDFYSFEYADLRKNQTIPLLKIESDYTLQANGQLATRLEAFAESVAPKKELRKKNMGKGYVAGIDSGSTSTDVVILDQKREIVAEVILPTGAGAAQGAERALMQALNQAGLNREDVDALVTTGYGRAAIKEGDQNITEITCHARGAHYLDPAVRTVIDIGGQDSKVIRIDENGAVVNFVMNDKCAAGTGRFLEMMARTLELSLEEMSRMGLEYTEDITISSMCTVFAESEVVSLIAENKRTDDIVHGLNKAVASKTVSLVKRVGGEETYMMTGGVARNQGLVKTLEEKLGASLKISDKAQLCGALGAALYAWDMVKRGQEGGYMCEAEFT